MRKIMYLTIIIAIMCQQVGECYLKHVTDMFTLESEDVKSVLLSNNLVRINRVLLSNGIDLELDKQSLSVLKDYYFTARYPGDEFIEVSKEEMEEAYKIAIDIKQKVEKFLYGKKYCPICGSKLLSTGVCSNVNCEDKIDEDKYFNYISE